MAEMQVLSESQEFGRWGQPIPAQEFGRTWPQPMSQEFGRWGQPVPAQEFGKGFPQAMPQQFGGRIPFVDEGWRSPRLPFPPSTGRYLIH